MNNSNKTNNLSILSWQIKVFLRAAKKYRRIVIQKGRRLGFTYGLALFLSLASCTDPKIKKILWGDTVASNNVRYVYRYFYPILQQLEEEYGIFWDFKKQAAELDINGTTIDFRSADRPENWEGFGYDIIVLNEAGIILRNAYLYENAVLPMLLDNPNSLLVVGGTPKGKRWRGEPHKFFELCELAKTDPRWKHFHFTTYDNPLNKKKEIDALVNELPKSVVRQEIYGEFIDTMEATLFDCDTVHEAMTREPIPTKAPKICGIDIGWANDMTEIATRMGKRIYPIISIQPVKDDAAMAKMIANHLDVIKPKITFIDYGWGTGVVSILQNMGYNVIGVFFGSQASDKEKYANKRTEMFDDLRKWVDEGGVLPDDKMLAKELCSILVEPDARGRLKLVSKKDIEGDSPNKADACALTFAGVISSDFVNDMITEDYGVTAW